MSDAVGLVAALAAGAALGVAFFGGLWLTVRKARQSRRPALLLAGSFVLRMALLLGGLYLIGAHDWRRLLAAAAGIALARTILVRRLGPQTH